MTAQYNSNYQDSIYLHSDTSFIYRFNDQTGNKLSGNLQIEYTHSFNEKINLITGVSSYYQNYDEVTINDSYVYDNRFQNMRLNYYFDLFFRYKKFNLIVGSKIEDFKTFFSDTTDVNLLSFLPRVSVGFLFNSTHSIRLSYKRTSYYPSAWALNPVIIFSDSLNASQGNLNLKPALLNYTELNYKYRKKNNMISVSLYHSYIQNMFASVKKFDENMLCISRMENIDGKHKLGIKSSMSFSLFDEYLELEPIVDFFFEKFDNKISKKENLSCKATLDGYLYLPANFSFFFSTSYYGKNLTLQGYTEPKVLIDNISLRKNIFQGKASITLSYVNLGLKDIDVNIIETNDIYQKNQFNVDRQGFFVRFSYYLTKGKNVEMTRIEKNMEKDLK